MRIVNNKNEKHSALGEAGRISIGIMAEGNGGVKYPSTIDYFRARGEFAKFFHEVYGDKPKSIPVFFYSNDYNEACTERYELRNNAGKLVAYGDGNEFQVYDKESKTYKPFLVEQHKDIMDKLKNKLNAGVTDKKKLVDWSVVLTMRFMIRNIPVLGFWQISTKGAMTSIPNLRDRFDSCMAQFTFIKGLPFELTVKKVKSNKPEDSRQFPIIDLVPMFSFEKAKQLKDYVEKHLEFNTLELVTKPQMLLLDVGVTPPVLEAGTASTKQQINNPAPEDLFACEHHPVDREKGGQIIIVCSKCGIEL